MTARDNLRDNTVTQRLRANLLHATATRIQPTVNVLRTIVRTIAGRGPCGATLKGSGDP